MPGLPSLRRLEALSPRGMKLGLAAIDAVCERLGRPERRFPSVLISGTNGKGSTAATLSSIADAAGLRGGLYTSPHLERVTERIRVAERDLPEKALDEALARVFDAADRSPEVPLTYFEALTAAAFLAFSESSVELAVVEVGLGGRFDATNVLPALLSIVTSIGIDHTEELGATRALIAREKAGIFRRGRPALALASADESRDALREAAASAGADWHDASEEIRVSVEEVSIAGTRFRMETPGAHRHLQTPLAGAHQAWNAALAIRGAELLEPFQPGLAAGAARGLARVRWPGRLESVPIGGRTILLDGCHNVEGAEALMRFLAEAGIGSYGLVFGAMADKDVETIAARLFPAASRVLLVPAASPRAATPEDLARRTGLVRSDVSRAPTLSAALRDLLAAPNRDPIIVAGSLYLVGEARTLLESGELESE